MSPGLRGARVLGAAEHERDRGGERGTVAGISGADGTDPPCYPAVQAFRWKPWQPSPDGVGAGLALAEQDRVLPGVGAERLGTAPGVEGVGQPWHPSADRHQPQVARLGAGPLGERRQQRERRVPVQVAGGGIVQQGGGGSEVMAEQLPYRQAVDVGEAAKPGGQRLARVRLGVHRPPPGTTGRGHASSRSNRRRRSVGPA